MKTTKTPHVAVALALIVAPAFVGTELGCKKDEPPPPLPSAEPEPAPAPTTPLTIEPDVPIASASASVEPPKGKGVGGGVLKKCCDALAQNAQGAPEPNKTHMLNAAAVCRAANGAGQASGVALGAIRAALAGAGLPPGCK
jgi:hypothetical protein